MRFVADDKQERTINIREEIKFSSTTSYHLIVLTIRVKGENQLNDNTTDDEDLTVQIDGKNFPKLSDKNDLIDSPAAFSGGKQHNLSKNVYFLIYLQGTNHKLVLNADNPPGTAIFEKLEIFAFDPIDRLSLEPKIKAEDGDRRSWITFVLDNIPLQNIDVTITYSRRKGDSDDVKIKIDGQTQENILRNIKHFLWYFAGLLIPSISPTRTESQTFETNFSAGLHYIELDADRMPTLEKVILNFGSQLSVPKRIPTIDDPEWTGDFNDDTETMVLARLIFGEARNQPEEAMTGVGWVVKNRLVAHRAEWGDTYHKVIQAKLQFSSFNPENWNFPILTDPLNGADKITQKAWKLTYKVAESVVNGLLEDPTDGALFFHSADLPREEFVTKKVPGAIFIKQIGAMLFYKI